MFSSVEHSTSTDYCGIIVAEQGRDGTRRCEFMAEYYVLLITFILTTKLPARIDPRFFHIGQTALKI